MCIDETLFSTDYNPYFCILMQRVCYEPSCETCKEMKEIENNNRSEKNDT